MLTAIGMEPDLLSPTTVREFSAGDLGLPALMIAVLTLVGAQVFRRGNALAEHADQPAQT